MAVQVLVAHRGRITERFEVREDRDRWQRAQAAHQPLDLPHGQPELFARLECAPNFDGNPENMRAKFGAIWQ